MRPPTDGGGTGSRRRVGDQGDPGGNSGFRDLRANGLDFVAEAISDMGPGEIIAIADLPSVVRAVFPDVGGLIALDWRGLRHMYSSHPEMNGLERYIVEALRTPSNLFLDGRYPNTTNFTAPIGTKHHAIVLVEVDLPGSRHRVKSARKHRSARTTKLKHRTENKFGRKGVLIDDGG